MKEVNPLDASIGRHEHIRSQAELYYLNPRTLENDIDAFFTSVGACSDEGRVVGVGSVDVVQADVLLHQSLQQNQSPLHQIKTARL